MSSGGTPANKLVKPSQPAASTKVPSSTAEVAFLNAEYSDVQIICGGKTFAAHKLVICMRSHWFKTACDDSSASSTASPKEIRLDDHEPILIERVIEFLYKGEYTMKYVAADSSRPGLRESPLQDEPVSRKRKRDQLEDTPIKQEKTSTKNSTPILVTKAWPPLAQCPPCYFHAQMFAVAEYFKLVDLKAYAAKRFSDSLSSCNRPWKLEVIIRELWSDRANYSTLKGLLLIRRASPNEKIRDVFLQLTPSFFQSVPRFAVDFCSNFVSLRKPDFLRSQHGKHVDYVSVD